MNLEKFDWTPQGLSESLEALETVAVCLGGNIPHPSPSLDGTSLDGPTPKLRLVGGGIESIFTAAGKDNIVKVVDSGEGLCAQNNPIGQQIDIFIGYGSQAYNQYFINIVQTSEMQVYLEE